MENKSEPYTCTYIIPALTLYLHLHYTCTYIIPALTLYLHLHYTCTHIIPALTLYLHLHYMCTYIIPAPTLYLHLHYTCTYIIPALTLYLHLHRVAESSFFSRSAVGADRCLSAERYAVDPVVVFRLLCLPGVRLLFVPSVRRTSFFCIAAV